MGIPRAGTPRRIFQTANDITMLYTTSDYGGGNRPWGAGRATRWCSTPSRLSIRRGSDEEASSIPPTCTSWRNSRVRADEILYEITVEDPDVLVEPWVREPRTLRLNQAADAGLVAERAHCEIYEESSITTQLRH